MCRGVVEGVEIIPGLGIETEGNGGVRVICHPGRESRGAAGMGQPELGDE